MSYLFYGGIFLSPTEVETVRAAAYKYYHLDPVYHEGKLPRVMLMTRAKVAGNLPGRKIANQNELSLFLRQSKQWLYSEGAMELLTPEEQAATMLNTDVLIGVLGSGFANVIYMLPGASPFPSRRRSSAASSSARWRSTARSGTCRCTTTASSRRTSARGCWERTER